MFHLINHLTDITAIMQSILNSDNNNSVSRNKSSSCRDNNTVGKMVPTSRIGSGSRNILFLCTCVLLTFCFVLDTAHCDYENTWNFYYEQPCCGNPTGFSAHHVRHHRGEFVLVSYFLVLNMRCVVALVVRASTVSLEMVSMNSSLKVSLHDETDVSNVADAFGIIDVLSVVDAVDAIDTTSTVHIRRQKRYR